MRDRRMRAARILLAVVHCSSHLARIIQSNVAAGSGQTVATLNDLIGWLGWRKRQPRKASCLPIFREIDPSLFFCRR
jgi:hypothetical protein